MCYGVTQCPSVNFYVNNLHGMHHVVSHHSILWDCLHNNYIDIQTDTNVPAFVYLVKASLHVSTLTRSSSGDYRIITIFYHSFSEYTLLLKHNLTNRQFFFKLSLKIKIKIKYMVWININIVTWMATTLLRNGPVNTPPQIHTRQQWNICFSGGMLSRVAR
jgi:hypothetical protein